MSDEQKSAEVALYEALATPFTVTFRDMRGGVELEYVTGEQVTTRLNEELGFLAWSFKVLEHGIHAEADECWVMAELTVHVGDRTVIRQQFGSQKVKRSRASGTPMDIGFDLKGATTDALKKCASLVGVGLYLHEKTPQAPAYQSPRNDQPQGNQQSGSRGGQALAGDMAGESFICEECGEPLGETRFKDGSVWDASQLAVFGRRKHSRILCMTHYREANQAKRRAEEALQQVPF